MESLNSVTIFCVDNVGNSSEKTMIWWRIFVTGSNAVTRNFTLLVYIAWLDKVHYSWQGLDFMQKEPYLCVYNDSALKLIATGIILLQNKVWGTTFAQTLTYLANYLKMATQLISSLKVKLLKLLQVSVI